MKRNEIFDEWKKKNVVADDGIAFRTDEDVERIYFTWRGQGAPEHAYVGIEGLSSVVIITTEAPDLEV